jgi:hypothetical protein
MFDLSRAFCNFHSTVGNIWIYASIVAKRADLQDRAIACYSEPPTNSADRSTAALDISRIVNYVAIIDECGNTVVEFNTDTPVERISVSNDGRFVIHTPRRPWNDMDHRIVIMMYDSSGHMIKYIDEGYYIT